MSIEDTLLKWYHKNKRPLPWRNTKDPFTIWISEIILQQTRIKQGTPYFEKFITRFPTVNDLAIAHENEILHMWQGLGYYSRARNLHFSAKYIKTELKGKFPSNYKDIIKLKGVGEYTAAAIASFCFNERVAAIDGNVYRVITRLFDIKEAIDKSLGKNKVAAICNKLIPKNNPGDFNQALMDFGATLCLPKNPDCENCPLDTKCLSKQNNTQLKRPVKLVRIKQRKRYFTYIVAYDNRHIFINKRKGNDIWKELYEFPLIESDAELNINELKRHESFKQITMNEKVLELKIVKTKPHILSHQKIESTFILLNLSKVSNNSYTKILIQNISKYAFPVLISKFIKSNLNMDI